MKRKIMQSILEQSILEQSSVQGSAESHLRFPHHWVFLRPGRRRPTTCVSCSIFTADTSSFPDPPTKGLIWIIEKGAAWPPVCLALFSLWTLLHMYFSWYPQSAYSIATFLLLWSVWILLWLWNEKYMIYGSQPILYLETKQYNQFCIKQHYVTVKFSNCKRSWYCGKSWYYQRNSHHEEARMHEG